MTLMGPSVKVPFPPTRYIRISDTLKEKRREGGEGKSGGREGRWRRGEEGRERGVGGEGKGWMDGT